MKLAYGTDFHGDKNKYEFILRFAVDHDVRLIHLGADILPKGSSILSEQKKFVKGYLKEFYKRCAEKGIKVLAMFGNDDIKTRKVYFREYGTLLDEQPYTQDGYEFLGYPFVPDYPFGLKDSCKLDHDEWRPEQYISIPVEATEKGLVPIPNIKEYFIKKGTIKDDLIKIKANRDTIMSMHCPPHGLGLDVCYGGRRVGSKSILDWISREQPLLVLCGHIHESYECSGIWKVEVGKTVVIQPGQSEFKTTMVLIEVNEQRVSANLVTI